MITYNIFGPFNLHICPTTNCMDFVFNEKNKIQSYKLIKHIVYDI